ncbi:MAG: enoyl-CoA hydratase-related protein [Janthinobacterium lividum]
MGQPSALQTIKLSVDERGVALVELHRPDVFNAFDETMIAELGECFVSLAARDDVRVVVLGSSGKVFSAGADLNWMRRASVNSHEKNVDDARRFTQMMEAIYLCPKPTVARVQGSAFGGGVGLVCACDIVVASEKAKFAVTETRFGILPAVIGPYLVESIGVRQARRLALTATPFSAEEARQFGLVHTVVEHDALASQVDATVTELVGNGPTSLSEVKILFGKIGRRAIDAEVSELTAQTIARVRATDEAKEGFAAFFDKRKASWSRS